MPTPIPGPPDALTSPEPGSGRGRMLLLPLLLAALLAVVAFRHGSRLYDDAFITMRYARNLVDGHGLVYNPGERVLGTSAPLYALVLALPAFALGSAALPAISTAIGLAALVGTVLVSFRIVARFAPPWAAALGVAAALTPVDTLQAFASGMETPLYLLGLALAIERSAAGRHRLALFVAAALPFLHPEGVLLFPALLVAARVERGRWPLREALAPAAAATAGALALTLLFGSPLPHSVTAKGLVYERAPGSALHDLGGALVGAILPPAAPRGVGERLGEALTVAEVGVLLALFGLLGFLVLRHRSALRAEAAVALSLFAALYLAFFAAGNPLVFPWYRPPLVLVSGLVVALVLGRALGPGAGSRNVARAFAVLVLLCVAGRLALFRPFDTRLREEAYREAILALGAPAESVVAAPEIGVIGFYTPARILDTAGLVSPVALPFFSVPRGDLGRPRAAGLPAGTIPPGLVAALAPDFVVTRSRFLEALLRVEPSALHGYERLDLGLGPRAVEAQLLVYRRVSAPAAGPAATK